MVELVEGQTVVCDLTQERTHGRRVGWCYLDGQDIAEALIKAGLVRDCPQFSEGPYAAAETRSSTRAAVSGLLPAEIAGTRRWHGSLWSPSSASPSPLMCIPWGHESASSGFLVQFGLDVGHVRPNRGRPPTGFSRGG